MGKIKSFSSQDLKLMAGMVKTSRAENWTDAIVLVLVCFYLYQLIKGSCLCFEPL